MTDLGLLHFFLGLEIWQHSQGIFVSQQRYVQELLVAFNMVDARHISSPMDVNQKFSESDDSSAANSHLYQRLIGSLIWLLNTRCGINFVVGVSWQVLWVLLYKLIGTRDCVFFGI